MAPIPNRLLKNRVVLQKRTTTPNGTGELVEAFAPEGDAFPASVQDEAAQELTLPDIDGPVVISTRIFANLAAGGEVRHLDRLLQTDVTPNRLYRVVFDNDAVGWHHHFEFKAERLLVLEVEPS